MLLLPLLFLLLHLHVMALLFMLFLRFCQLLGLTSLQLRVRNSFFRWCACMLVRSWVSMLLPLQLSAIRMMLLGLWGLLLLGV